MFGLVESWGLTMAISFNPLEISIESPIPVASPIYRTNPNDHHIHQATPHPHPTTEFPVSTVLLQKGFDTWLGLLHLQQRADAMQHLHVRLAGPMLPSSWRCSTSPPSNTHGWPVKKNILGSQSWFHVNILDEQIGAKSTGLGEIELPASIFVQPAKTTWLVSVEIYPGNQGFCAMFSRQVLSKTFLGDFGSVADFKVL